MSVTTSSAATMTKLSANRAGRNCILAIHPSQRCNVPVKSRNNRVMPTNSNVANICLILFSFIVLFRKVTFNRLCNEVPNHQNLSKVTHFWEKIINIDTKNIT